MASPSSAKDARHGLASALEAGAQDHVTVYSEPPEQMTSPAYVIGPEAPYREQSTICAEQVNLRVSCVVPRSSGMDDLDDLIDSAKDIIGPLDWAVWESIETVGVGVNVGGTEHIVATVRVRASIGG